jgi:hypothetical protein
MRKGCNHRFLKGAVAGMIGGLVASWAMNQFQAGLSKAEAAWKKSGRKTDSPQESPEGGDEPATALVARRVSRAVLGRDLSGSEMKVAEPLVHYTYGTLAGGFYGLLAELMPAARKGAGTAYATALWVGGDEIAVPMLQLSKPPDAYPAKVHAQSLASHLVYGVAAEGVRRGIRALL